MLQIAQKRGQKDFFPFVRSLFTTMPLEGNGDNINPLQRCASMHFSYEPLDNDDVGIIVHTDLGYLPSSEQKLDLDDCSGGGGGWYGDNNPLRSTVTGDDGGSRSYRMMFDQSIIYIGELVQGKDE